MTKRKGTYNRTDGRIVNYGFPLDQKFAPDFEPFEYDDSTVIPSESRIDLATKKIVPLYEMTPMVMSGVLEITTACPFNLVCECADEPPLHPILPKNPTYAQVIQFKKELVAYHQWFEDNPSVTVQKTPSAGKMSAAITSFPKTWHQRITHRLCKGSVKITNGKVVTK